MIFKRLTNVSLDDIRELEDKNKSEYYVPSSDSTWHNILFKDDSYIIGVYEQDKLVAYASAFIAYRSQYNKEIEEYFKVDPNKAVFLNYTLVDKNHRGKNIQLKLRRKTFEFYSSFDYEFITTVSQNNAISNNNIKKLGLKLIKTGYMPYSKDLKNLYKGKLL